jgi:NADH:ubiquinone oxidoreductase subunit H
MDYIPPFVWYFGKTGFIIWLMMWFKWTFPRLRIDQLVDPRMEIPAYPSTFSIFS